MNKPFEKYLNQDEHIIWQGQPNNIFSIKFIFFNTFPSLFILGFFPIWQLLFFTQDLPIVFKVVISLFLLLCILNLFFIYPLHYFRRSRTFYAITEQRIFISYWFFGKNIKSYKIKSLPKPIFRHHSNDIATILINYEKPWSFRIFTNFIEYS